MGCQACRQAEPEASFPLIETDIKNLDKQNLSPQERNEDYNNFQTLEKQYPQLKERMIKVKEQYQGTYWYYYKYEKPY